MVITALSEVSWGAFFSTIILPYEPIGTKTLAIYKCFIVIHQPLDSQQNSKLLTMKVSPQLLVKWHRIMRN